MKVFETIGMIATGAGVTLGAVYLLGLTGSPDTLPAVSMQNALNGTQQAPDLAPETEPTVASAPQPVAPQPVAVQAPPAVEVTRSAPDLSGVDVVGQLENFVALSLEPQVEEIELTPEQEEIIAYFERTARDLNSASDGYAGEYVAFNDMAINSLEIRHFYTVQQPLADIPVDTLLASQSELVQANMCQEPMMRTLIEEHGFRFTYSYVSQDNRFLGNVRGDLETCTG